MSLQTETNDGILVITLDDGGRNALLPETFTALGAALDAGGDADAIVLAGREGALTVGLDVKWMQAAGRDDVGDMLRQLGRTCMRLWTDPRPTVCAATGHALAAGTMLTMACDHTVAAEGSYAWGLVETRIDFEMPRYGLTLARHNVRADRLEPLLIAGERVDPATAVEVGFADELCAPDDVLPRAMGRARELAELPARAYGRTKARLRADAAARVLDEIDADITEVVAHLPAQVN